MNIERIDSIRNFLKIGSDSYLSYAASDFVKLVGNKVQYALCGGLVVGLYGRARGTDDIDIIIKNESDIDIIVNLVSGIFNHNRKHCIVHIKTGVEIGLLTAEFLNINNLNINNDLVNMAIDTALTKNIGALKIPVVSKEGLIALKLQRGNEYDIGDIKNILRNNSIIDLNSWKLSLTNKTLFDKIVSELKNETKNDDKIDKRKE